MLRCHCNLNIIMLITLSSILESLDLQLLIKLISGVKKLPFEYLYNRLAQNKL